MTKALWAGVILLVALVGCSNGSGANDAGPNDPGANDAAPNAPGANDSGTAHNSANDDNTARATTPSHATDHDAGHLDDFVGKGLQYAEDQAENAGFETESHDASGRDRLQILTNGWQVCFQDPAAGAVEPGTKVDLGVVKLGEKCPETDLSKNIPSLGPDKELPDFTGRNLQEATNTLGSSASVDPVDATDDDRNVFIPQNWKICDQSPAAGTTWDGEPITFQVVKYGERCP